MTKTGLNSTVAEFPEIKEKDIKSVIERALAEDVGTGDITTNALVTPRQKGIAIWKTKDSGIVAGLEIGRRVFEYFDAELEWQPEIEDGDYVEEGTTIVTIKGSSRALLTAERTALNIVQRISGIATKTSHFVQKVSSYPTKILDTRKTMPGLRLLDKYAVAAGGGVNHRMGLFDLAMIKDNHIVAAGGIKKAIEAIKKYDSSVQVEVETTSLVQVKEAVQANADIIMLDNMRLPMMRDAVAVIDGKAKIEASGNMTLDRVAGVAQTGVDYISVGALTHSVKAFDISQQFTELN